MAKKKDNVLSYLQMPLPEGRKYYKMVKRSWGGLNYRQTIDTGALSMEKNISTLEAPYLTPSQERVSVTDRYNHPIDMFGFDGFLLVIYRDAAAIKVDYIMLDADGDIAYDETKKADAIYTGVLKASGATSEDEYPRCVVQFNVYEESDDIVNGTYKKKLLIFPDKKSMYFDADALLSDESNDTGNDFALYDMDVTIREYYNKTAPYLPPETANHAYYYRNTYKCAETLQGTAVYRYCQYDTVDEEGKNDGGSAYDWKISAAPAFPNIKYAVVHVSRLFGVSDDSVYASGFNDYTNWNMDTTDSYNESNAWCSKAQSNTKADGVFTGITNFQGHVVCFKRDYMHEIYNTKNPFRIQDIFAEGAIDNRTIQDVDGKLFFVSADDVKIYTGANPRIIGYNLNMSEYINAVSGTDGRCYYLYCENSAGDGRLFAYDTYTEYWSEQAAPGTVLSFAHNKRGMYMLCLDGKIYRMDTELYAHDWSFETDLITNETVDIKHIKKLQMLADIGSGACLKVYFLYDDEKFNKQTSHLVYTSSGTGQKAIRAKPRPTASYGVKLHIEGHGYVKLYELELFMETGGDLYA